MRRVLLTVLLGVTTVLVLSVGAVGATAKSTAFKTGTYKLHHLPPGGIVILKQAECAGKHQLCVALPKSPGIVCMGGPDETFRAGNFSTPVALPSSGKLTEHAPIPINLAAPGQTPINATGQSAFSIAFKKNGTASGYFEVSLTYPLLGNQTTPFKCSGKVKFTGKLG